MNSFFKTFPGYVWANKLAQSVSHRVYRRLDMGTRTLVGAEGTDAAENRSCICLNCGTAFTGDYCPCCGQKASTGRITVKRSVQRLLAAMASLDGRFLKTMGNLFWRPGHLVRDYITGKRAMYVHPVSLLSALVAIYIFLIFAFGMEAGKVEIVSEDIISENVHSTTLKSLISHMNVMLGNKVVSSLLSAFVCLFPFALMFWRKRIPTPANSISCGKDSIRLNLAEHFCALVYTACLYFTLSFVLKLAQYAGLSNPAASNLDILLYVLMPIVVYKQLYKAGWWTAIWRCLLAMLLALAILISVFGLTYGIDQVV